MFSKYASLGVVPTIQLYFKMRTARATGNHNVPPASRHVLADDAAAFGSFPRCIASLMVLCARGEHLYHEERVLLANYMNT